MGSRRCALRIKDGKRVPALERRVWARPAGRQDSGGVVAILPEARTEGWERRQRAGAAGSGEFQNKPLIARDRIRKGPKEGLPERVPGSVAVRKIAAPPVSDRGAASGVVDAKRAESG